MADIEVSTQADTKASVQADTNGGFPGGTNGPTLLTGHVNHVTSRLWQEMYTYFNVSCFHLLGIN